MNQPVTEDAAKNYIDQFLNNKVEEKTQTKAAEPETNNTQYQDVHLEHLPLGKLYHPSFRIQIRAANLAEIQHYSTIDNSSEYDIRNHLDDLLASCVKVYSPYRHNGSYLDIKVGDRLYFALMIRELTFQKGRLLTVPVQCAQDETKFDIELMRQNLEFWPEDEELWQYYNPEAFAFEFLTTLQDEPFRITLPTIGTQRAFLDWIFMKRRQNKTINEAFVKIAPYLSMHKSEWTHQELDEFEQDFVSKLTEPKFQFLNSAIEKFKKNEFKVGIRGLVKRCPRCGTEVRTGTVFPRRASDFLIIPDAFGFFIKK